MIEFGNCPKCGKHTHLLPLHGDRGGPLTCGLCIGAWNAEHTKAHRAGRRVVKAMDVYLREGGKWGDLDKLKLCAGGNSGFATDFLERLIGFKLDSTAADEGELSAELLADTIALVHPDKHPPERREQANHVTQRLLALKPFVFPASKPKPIVPPPRDTSANVARSDIAKPSRPQYPCELCAPEVPRYYCDACRAEWDKRRRDERERENAKQRKRYNYRRHIDKLRMVTVPCPGCGEPFKPPRKNAKHCTPACRQKAYRSRADNPSKQPGRYTVATMAENRDIG